MTTTTDIEIDLIDIDDAESIFGKNDIALIKDALGDKNIAQYFDLSVLMTVFVDGVEAGKGYISELSDEITFKLIIPEELRNVEEGVTRNYYIIRVHDGEVEIIVPTVEGNTLYFKTDKFSTYALAYEDVQVTDGEKTPNTGDDNNLIAWMGIMLLGLAGTTVLRRKND